ncbi:hypothetical protein SAP2_06150 [Staphylococcus arlettae]|nr:hypothetical protein SAP2_06150 [Staphylococcus arlettae]
MYHSLRYGTPLCNFKFMNNIKTKIYSITNLLPIQYAVVILNVSKRFILKLNTIIWFIIIHATGLL